MSNELSSTTTINKGTNVQVAVRCRPVNAEEKKNSQPTVVTCDVENKSIKLAYGPTGKKIMKNYTFDKVFGAYSRQEEVFDAIVRPIVDETLAGFNCTIFAYGQTGTGKTHTMEGDINSEEDAGIVPRSVKAILEQLEGSGTEFTIRVSFLELYNEELQDLLNTSGEKNLKLCEDAKRGVVCQNLEEITVRNVPDIFKILTRGIQQRQTAATLCNKNSSRSHSIFTMKIMIKESNVEGEEVVRHGQLNLVDLAGSECIGRSGAKNDRAREAGSINQSLLTLGRVITALVDHHGHIPYRDSKLTRLLQESLGGKAKTCIIATLSPSASAVEETMSTLDYAYRAKNIKNQPTLNQRLTKKVVMKEYFAEIETLKMQLQATREKNGVYVDPAEYYGMETRLTAQESQITECEAALKARNEEYKYVKAEKEDLTARLETKESECDKMTVELLESKVSLHKVKGELSTAFVELKSVEAVVGEQVATEQSLLSQSEQVANSLEARQDDVERLLGKVDRLASKESERMNVTKSFVSTLNSSSSNLVEQVSVLATQSKDHSVTLCAGVEQILSRGRDTCETLKGSIDSALSTLTNDAEAARDVMTTSCGDLKTHLQGTNSQLAQTLLGLQQQLSQWLVDADSSLKQAQQHLVSQQAQIETASAAIATNCAQLKDESASFIAAQESFKTSSINQVNDLKVELTYKLDAYKKASEQTMRDANVALQTKAEKMESAMRLMLKDIVDSSAVAMDAVGTNAATMMNETENMMELGMAQTVFGLDTFYQTCATHVGVMNARVEGTKSAYKADINTVTKSRDQTFGLLSGVSDSVGNKRKFLEETVSRLTSEVGVAIQEGCSSVDQTSETANKILRDVNGAAVRMNESASASMNSFTSYMDREGDVISSELNKHFSAVEHHLAAQQSGLEGIKERASNHGSKIVETVLQATGNTPKKSIFAPREQFASTRDHNEIRSERREQLFSVDYSAVSSELASSYTAFPSAESQRSSPMTLSMDVDSTTSSAAVSPVAATTPVVVAAPVAVKAAKVGLEINTTSAVTDENAPPAPNSVNSSRLPTKRSTSTKEMGNVAVRTSRSNSAANVIDSI